MYSIFTYVFYYMLGYKTTEPKLSELHRMIVHKYAAKWRKLGKLLDIPTHTLAEIAVNNTNHPHFNEQCCMAVLEKWFKSTTEPTWCTIQKAIDYLSKEH